MPCKHYCGGGIRDVACYAAIWRSKTRLAYSGKYVQPFMAHWV